MTPFGHIRYAAKSDVGRKRKNNEDSYGVFPSCGVFCVADGMGGGDDGEVASNATVDGVRRFCEAHPFPDGMAWRMDDWLDGVSGGVSEASAWIHGRTRERGLRVCGSTFVGVCFDAAHPSRPVALHAGDSRLYLLRGRGIRQVTKDHSAAEMIGVKDERDMNPLFRGMILRAVGVHPSVELERTMFTVRQGDRIILCSDGLSKMLADRRIAALGRAGGPLEDVAASLVAAANDAGGADNVTVVVVEVGALPAALPALPVQDCAARSAETGDTCDADSVDESDTRDTGVTVAADGAPASGGDGDTVSDPNPGPVRRHVPVKVWAAFGVAVALVLLAAIFGWLVRRRISADAAAEEARRAEMSTAVETMSRQTSEKERRRAKEAETLRAEDEAKASREREDERRRFQGNVDLPVE